MSQEKEFPRVYIFCLIGFLIVYAGFVFIMANSAFNTPIVNGSVTEKPEIKLYAGQSVNAGNSYGAHYNGNGLFFVHNTYGGNWEVDPYSSTPFKLGDIWYTHVRDEYDGAIIIREVSPP
jgi:hypothetical protein